MSEFQIVHGFFRFKPGGGELLFICTVYFMLYRPVFLEELLAISKILSPYFLFIDFILLSLSLFSSVIQEHEDLKIKLT